MELPLENQASMSDQFLSMIHRIIEDNLDNENFSVEELAEKARLSRSMLHRKLIKLTGKSATDLIMEIRLTRAKELLEKDVATASEIAYKVGFNSVSYFHRVFKKRFKISPGDVKKNATANLYQSPTNPRQDIQVSNKSKTHRRWTYPVIALVAVSIVIVGILYVSGEKKPSEKSIAILPFDNLSRDEENQYIADGIVEDLLNRLSSIGDLKVISRTSSEMFRRKGSKSVPEIAGILGVNYILEGSVQRDDNNVRISVQLIDAFKDDHILSKQYNRNFTEVFKLQSEIAREIVSELSVYLSDEQLISLQRNQINNVKAFNYYQMGRYNICRCSKEETLASIDYFNKAIQEDSSFALAYAGLADAYRVMAGDGYMNDKRAGRDTAFMLALKALDLDKNLAEAHTVLAGIYMGIDFNMEAAEKEFRKAIELNPNGSVTYKEYTKFLAMTGRPEEARESINKAIALDPFSFTNRNQSTILYWAEKDFRHALEENQISLELVKDHPYAVDRLFFFYLGLGDEKAALESFKKAGALRGEYTEEQADSAFQTSGINGLLRLKAKTWIWPAGRAYCYILLGENETAIEMLESALNENRLFPFDLCQFDTKNLESDPRFLAIKKKLGLENY